MYLTGKKGGDEVMSETSQRPRSPRVPVEFALDVVGTDAAGQSFQAKAKATKISRGGATLLIDVDVPLGSMVELVPPSGGKLTAEVNGSWIDDIDGNRRIGVKLLDANGWFAE
jgi:PilZ domain